jgi:hypothetical protein
MATAYVDVIERRYVRYKLEGVHNRDDVYFIYAEGEVIEEDWLDDIINDIEFEDIEEDDDV